MPKYIPAADKIFTGLFAAKNRLFDFVQKSLDEGKEEKEIMKEIKETLTADPSVLLEIEHTFFKKKDKSASVTPTKRVSVNPYRTNKAATWIDDAKVGDQVELNDETGEVTYIGNDKIEVKTPTKTETIWKN